MASGATYQASLVALTVKNLPSVQGDPGSIPGLGRSPGDGSGYPLQYSFLENSMDRGASWATVQGVAKSWTQLRLTFSLLSLIVGKYLISFIFFVGYLLRDLWIYYHRVK